MSIQQMLMASSGSSPLIVDAADFDGTDYLTRGAGITAPDAKQFLFVAWLRKDGSDGTGNKIFTGNSVLAGAGATERFAISKTSTDLIGIIGKNAAGTTILEAYTSTFNVASGWKCVMILGDLNTSTIQMYFGDTSVLVTTTTITNDLIDFGLAADYSIGATCSGATLADMFFGPLMFWTFAGLPTGLSLATESVRRLFYGANGKPVNPTAAMAAYGTPNCLHYILDGEAPANYAVNRGFGGNFTVNGTLTTAANSPSD